MDDFGVVLELINTEERQSFNSLWGPLKYIKAAEFEFDGKKIPQEEVLFDNIKRVSSTTGINTVLFRHAEVFKYLGEGRIFDFIKARTYMLKMLSALYYPEENLNFVYEGNPLRKVLEYIFHTANKFGLLPDECIEANGTPRSTDASRYMAGKECKGYKGSKLTHKLRFGEPGPGKEGSGGDRIFNEQVAMFVQNILNYANMDSHTNKDESYVIEEDKKEIFFGYVLQLCHIIKWFGAYIESNSDVETNKSKIRIITVDTDNADENKTDKQEEKSILIPTLESLIGTEANIISYGTKGKLACGTYCKLDSKYISKIGKKATIKSLEVNKGKDSKELPYIATEIEIAE